MAPPLHELVVETDASQQDRDYLLGLKVFHYLGSGFAFLIALLVCFYVVIATFFGHRGLPPGFNPWPDELRSPDAWPWGFIILRALGIVGLTLLALLMLASARCLGERRNYRFCRATAVAECLFVPYGTVLGIVTLAVLKRSSIRRAFGVAADELVPAASCPCALRRSEEPIP